MAPWQVEFAIVPRRALTNTPRVELTRIMETNWWSGERLPSEFAKQLAAAAPSGNASRPEVQTWGEQDGNRIDLWSENGKPVRMSARIDARRLDAKFGAMLLQFARVANAVLIRRDGLVVEPLVGALGAAMRSSDAWQYAAGPAANLPSSSDRDDDDG